MCECVSVHFTAPKYTSVHFYASFLASTQARPSIAIKDTIVFDQYFGLGPSSGSIEFWGITSSQYII